MSNDVTQVLIDMVKEVQTDIKDIKEKQVETSVSISVVKTMQEAIENLELDKRLRKVESQQSQSTGGVSATQWLLTTGLAVVGIAIALLKH